MASATERLYASRRGVRRKQERIDTTTSVLDAVSQVLAFAGGQAKKADTAWDEYEAGYKELGGTDFKRPEFGDEGYFKGPKGEVQIGKGRKYKTYDMEQVRKAGSFLGSDAAAVLGDDMRTKYLERTAPGVEKIRHHDPTKSYPESYQQMPIDPSTIDPGTGIGFVSTPISPKHERMMRVRSAPPPTESYQQIQSIPEEQIGGVDPRGLQRMRVADSENIPEFNIQQPIDPDDGKPFIKRDIGWGEALYDYKSLFEKMDIFPRIWKDKPGSKLPKSYAKGGNFITNGPQEILVGDNPGGRERVTIIPLPPSNDEEYKKRSLLESLYENNRRRKKY